MAGYLDEVSSQPTGSADLRKSTDLMAQNERLTTLLKDAKDQLVTLRNEIDRLASPPSGYGVVLETHEDQTLDIFTGGRKLRVKTSPTLDIETLRPGQEVMLNESLNVVAAFGYESAGEIVTLKEVLTNGRVLVVSRADEERVARLADSLLSEPIKPGDALLLEPKSLFVFERIPRAEVEELVLEDVPDVSRASAASPAKLIRSETLLNCPTSMQNFLSHTIFAHPKGSSSMDHLDAARP
jgi:ATP-dependent 26S proteasome regulatory subunit